MKGIIAFAAALLLAFSGTRAQDTKSLYLKYSDMDEVSAVYISSSMFKMIGKIPDMQISGSDINLTPLIRSLSSMYVIDCEESEVSALIKEDVDKLVSDKKFELMMEHKENGEKVRIFTEGTETVVRSFLLIAEEKDKGCTFISLDGNMFRDKLSEVITSRMSQIE